MVTSGHDEDEVDDRPSSSSLTYDGRCSINIRTIFPLVSNWSGVEMWSYGGKRTWIHGSAQYCIPIDSTDLLQVENILRPFHFAHPPERVMRLIVKDIDIQEINIDIQVLK